MDEKWAVYYTQGQLLGERLVCVLRRSPSELLTYNLVCELRRLARSSSRVGVFLSPVVGDEK